MIRTVGILGPGTMGASIGYLCAMKGFSVLMWARSPESVERGKGRVESIISVGIKKGRLSEEQATEIREKIKWTTSLDDLGESDIVIESVAEDIELKKDLFGKLDGICKNSVILATNTSTKSVTEIASACSKHPERVLGLHFFNPAHIMKLVEVVKAVQTADEFVDEAVSFAKRLDKVPVVVKDFPGFIVNHLLVPFLNKAIEFWESGYSAEDLSKVARLGLGHPMGPLELADLIGLDVVRAMGETLYEAFKDSKYNPPVSLVNLTRAGRLGRKTKKGYLDYNSKK